MARPIAIDLFAGAGGMSLGFEQAGFDIVGAVEIDPVHCAVHKYNFPHCAIIPRSVVGLTGSEIRLATGIGNRKVDVVFGGPPCQGFSMIGQRVIDDPRNNLVLEFLRLVQELDADYFVFENVKGLTLGKHRALLDDITETAKNLGYIVQKPWQVLNAAHFDVPQHRERLILFGAKRGLALPKYPTPKSVPADGRRKGGGVSMGPTVTDALADLPDAEEFEALLHTDEVPFVSKVKPSRYAQELRCQTVESWHHGYVRAWNPKQLTSSARTQHTDISRRRFRDTEGGKTEPVSRFFKLSEAGLSNTLRAGTDGTRGAFTSPRPIHPIYDRCVTVREMARLHGYPDWFRFNATKWHGARQIGNSVPPPMARAIAEQVIDVLAWKGQQPTQTVALGDVSLLGMTVSQAAAHFGIDAPSSKRDRKSGARKRSQWQIEQERAASYG